jgi:hypothetical protein
LHDLATLPPISIRAEADSGPLANKRVHVCVGLVRQVEEEVKRLEAELAAKHALELQKFATKPGEGAAAVAADGEVRVGWVGGCARVCALCGEGAVHGQWASVRRACGARLTRVRPPRVHSCVFVCVYCGAGRAQRRASGSHRCPGFKTEVRRA